jgi:CO/xanthine dehydrogenase Mo-binding subunit
VVHPKRHATQIKVKIGAMKDGRIIAAETELYGDTGAYASLGEKVMTRATTHSAGPYDIEHVRADCYAMYTNNPPAGAFRGFGVTQSAFAVEQNMDILAQELGMDPIELRRRNALQVGSTTATGQELRESVGLLECIDWVEAKVKELDSVPPPNLPAGATVAWGMAAAYKNTGLGGGADDAAGAEVEVYPDGTAEIRSSSADMGQGLATIVAQATAEELGLPYDRVKVLLSDTDLSPDGGPTTASRQTYVTGNAARLAARCMRERMAAVAAEHWDAEPENIVFLGGELVAHKEIEKRIPFADAVCWLQAEGHETRLTVTYHAPETRPLGQGGDMHVAFGFAMLAAQVAVEPDSGKVRVLRFVAASDAGRALNPQALLGQIEGGLVMGIGTALTEEYEIEEGVPTTRRWADYQVPLANDVPEMHLHLVEHLTADGPYGAKGVGELPSIPAAPAICNAIEKAVGVRVTRLPVKPEDLVRPVS